MHIDYNTWRYCWVFIWLMNLLLGDCLDKMNKLGGLKWKVKIMCVYLLVVR